MEKKLEEIKWSAPWKVRLFILKILEKKKITYLQIGLEKKEWNDVIEMKLTTVRLLHYMQGLEEFRKKNLILGKNRKFPFSVLTPLLKLQIILENSISWPINIW